MARGYQKRVLQQGDRIELETATGEHVWLVAVKCPGGCVQLEIDTPAGCTVNVFRADGTQRPLREQSHHPR